jgi:hypothetical protein
LRNKQVKLSSSPKDLTFIDRGFDTLHVTEGFTDFFSLLTMNRRDMPGNFLVLNSLSFVSASLDILKLHDKVELYLDHDKSAQKALALSKNMYRRYTMPAAFITDIKTLTPISKTSTSKAGGYTYERDRQGSIGYFFF